MSKIQLLYKMRKFVVHRYGNISNIKTVKCGCNAILLFLFLHIQFCIKYLMANIVSF